MSNPAVVKFQQITIHNLPFFLDDNYGESIHIHYGDMRLDFTYSSLETLINELDASLSDEVFTPLKKKNGSNAFTMKHRSLKNLLRSAYNGAYEAKQQFKRFKRDFHKKSYKRLAPKMIDTIVNR